MNSHFLAATGCGEFIVLEDLAADDIGRFLGGLDRHRPALDRVCGKMDGTPDVLGVIGRRLAAVTAAAGGRDPG